MTFSADLKPAPSPLHSTIWVFFVDYRGFWARYNKHPVFNQPVVNMGVSPTLQKCSICFFTHSRINIFSIKCSIFRLLICWMVCRIEACTVHCTHTAMQCVVLRHGSIVRVKLRNRREFCTCHTHTFTKQSEKCTCQKISFSTVKYRRSFILIFNKKVYSFCVRRNCLKEFVIVRRKARGKICGQRDFWLQDIWNISTSSRYTYYGPNKVAGGLA